MWWADRRPPLGQSDYYRWYTHDEVYFVDNLGLNSFAGKHLGRNSSSRARMLQLYIEASLNRADWGEVDGSYCIAHARACLNREAGYYAKSINNI